MVHFRFFLYWGWGNVSGVVMPATEARWSACRSSAAHKSQVWMHFCNLSAEDRVGVTDGWIPKAHWLASTANQIWDTDLLRDPVSKHKVWSRQGGYTVSAWLPHTGAQTCTHKLFYAHQRNNIHMQKYIFYFIFTSSLTILYNVYDHIPLPQLLPDLYPFPTYPSLYPPLFKKKYQLQFMLLRYFCMCGLTWRMIVNLPGAAFFKK